MPTFSGKNMFGGLFSEQKVNDLIDRIKTQQEDQRQAYMEANPAQASYANIIQSGGLTPEQRAMFTAMQERRIASQQEAGGDALARRFAAQGIGGSGLANASLSNLFGQGLLARQEGESNLNQLALQNLMAATAGLADFERMRLGAQLQQEGWEARQPNWFGQTIGTIGGKFAGRAAENLADKWFKP